MGNATQATGPFQLLIVGGLVAEPAEDLRPVLPWWPVFRLTNADRWSFFRVHEANEWPEVIDVTQQVEQLLTDRLAEKIGRALKATQPKRGAAMMEHESSEIRPSVERRRHARIGDGDIVRAEPDRKDPKTGSLQYLDARGEPGSPYKVIDTLDAMLRAATITRAQHTAGDRFRIAYEMAGLPGVRAAPLMPQIRGSTPSTSKTDAQIDAMQTVDQSLRILVLGSPACRCVVAICGEGVSLNAWRERERIRRTTAQQILIDALEALRDLYEIA